MADTSKYTINLSAPATLTATLGAGKINVNDYTLAVEEVENGVKLTLTRGSKTETVFIPDGTKGEKGDKGDKGEQGPQGPKGDPGSDASVTAENIQSALGYAPVKDVQVAGNSVLVDGVAVIPVYTLRNDATYIGIYPLKTNSGTTGITLADGALAINPATDTRIASRSGNTGITPVNLDMAVKAAMCDGKGAAWTDAEQKAARERMGALGFDEESASINLYDPSLQTDETIAPHYYVSGAPYSSTNYDTMWNCTAPIPVKPSTMYTVGLVPAYHYVYGSEDIMIEKPWGMQVTVAFSTTLMGNILRVLARQTRSRRLQTAQVLDLTTLSARKSVLLN